MATVIRPEISIKNKYHICKHRHYELKHFCLQYPNWKKEYEALSKAYPQTSSVERFISSNGHSDPTSDKAIKCSLYLDRIKMIESAAKEADEVLWQYILKAVTEGLSFTYLRNALNIPCSRDIYYDRYRRFFWILNGLRD